MVNKSMRCAAKAAANAAARVHAAASESALASPADDSSSAAISSPAASTLMQAHVVHHVQRLLLPLQHLLLQAHVAVCHVRIMMMMAPTWSSSIPVSRTVCPTQRKLLRRPVLPGRLSTSLRVRGLVIPVRLMVTTRVCLVRRMRAMTHLLLLPLR